MTFFDWIKQQFHTLTVDKSRPKRNHRDHHHDYHQRKRLVDQSQKTNNDQKSPYAIQADNPATTLPEIKQSVDQVSPVTMVQSQVTFFYLDENHQIIKSPDILVGNRGESFHFKLPRFKNHYLVAIDHFTNHFLAYDQDVTLHFAVKEGLPVMVYTVDFDTGQILQPVKIISDKMGQKYEITAPKIDHFRVINSTGKKYGLFDNRTHGIIFYYRKEDWETVQPVAYFVRLNKHHLVFNEPNGYQLKTGLPANIIIKVFARIDTSNNKSWLNIGGFEWIENQHLEPSDPPIHNLIASMTKTSRNRVMLTGAVDFVPGQSISTFDKPYGKQAGKLLDGTKISIIATIVDDQNLIWYELENHQVIPKGYIKIDHG